MTTQAAKFLTYAQNLEDVLLWRALGHIKHGFYIDVGANDPVEHSVTKAFYDAGWRGINIEPLPAFHQAFMEQRRHDINLALAAGSSDGSLTLYDVADVNGWASPERDVAEQHRAAGHEVRELTVPVRTLASICSEYAQGQIHFLKIDVEGFEGEVLRGMDFTLWRPWVLVIEATVPGSRETMHESWEHLVLEQGYRYAWFDGLNRYYVAEEHEELMQHFTVQPNVFDEFISYHLESAWEANRSARTTLKDADERLKAKDAQLLATHERMGAVDERLRATAEALDETKKQAAASNTQLAEAHGRIDALGAELRDAHDRLAAQEQQSEHTIAALRDELAQAHLNGHHTSEWARDLEQRLTATHASTSWRVTRPVRMAGAVVKRVREPGFAKRLLLRTTRSQRLRKILIPILLRCPPLARRVSGVLQAARQSVPEALPAGVIEVPVELRGLPASVRGVLADLQRTRQHSKS